MKCFDVSAKFKRGFNVSVNIPDCRCIERVPFEIAVQKYGYNALVDPQVFVYNQTLSVLDVILSETTIGASFAINEQPFDHKTLKGEMINPGDDLIVNDIDIKIGNEAGIVIIKFNAFDI